MIDKPTDALDREIKMGDYITWPVTIGHSIYPHIGKVTNIEPSKRRRVGKGCTGAKGGSWPGIGPVSGV